MRNTITAITEQITHTDRYNLYWIKSTSLDQQQILETFKENGIEAVNIGFELANLLSSIKHTKYINIDAQEILQNLIESKSTLPEISKIKIVAIYNLGILFEPDLGLDPSYILKEISKTSTIILLWENQSNNTEKLFWDTTLTQIGFDFTDANLKEIKIPYEI